MSDPATSRATSTRDVVVDVLAVAVLGLLVVSGLDDSYAHHGYLVVAAVALAVTTCWGLICLAQGWSVPVYLLAVVLGLPLVGAWTVYRNVDWLGLPSAAAVERALTGALTGPAEFLTTIAPVDVEGDVLTIPFVLAYLSGALSVAFALRTRRPLLPSVPHVLALAAVILLGTAEPAELAARSIAIGGVVALWVVARDARQETSLHARRGLLVRALSAVAVVAVAGVAVGAALPDQTGGRVVLRGRVGSGQDVSQLDSPLSTFRKFTRQATGTTDNLFDRRLLEVKGLPRGAVLRIVALDQYDGSTWSPGNRTVPGDDGALFQRIASQVGARHEGRRVRVGVEVANAWSSSWLPLAGELTGVSFDFLDGRAQRDDVRYNVATQTGMVVGGLALGDDYTFTAVLPDSTLRRTMTAYGTGRPRVAAGAFLDGDLAPWRTSGLPPVRQVFSLARYLRVNGRYSDGSSVAERRYLPGHGQVRLGKQFIEAPTIVGDDEQYAAFMALAANRLGVPARVVVGARPEASGIVRGRDVAAWVELRVSDGTWRVLPTSAFMSHRPPKRSDVRQSPASYVQTTVPRPDTADKPAGQVQQPQAPSRPRQRGTGHTAGGIVPIAVLVLVLVVGLVPALKVLRLRRRWRRRLGSARVVGGWDELLDQVEDRGSDVRHGRPRVEQARMLGLPVDLAREADVLVFGRDQPADEDVAAFMSAVRTELRARAHGSRPVPRVRGWWNPRSLVRRLRRRRLAARVTSPRTAQSRHHVVEERTQTRDVVLVGARSQGQRGGVPEGQGAEGDPRASSGDGVEGG
jgi:hypothetical protein